jgi:hypothetical protein
MAGTTGIPSHKSYTTLGTWRLRRRSRCPGAVAS